MIQLSKSGLPMQMDEESGRIILGEGLAMEGYAGKAAGKMAGLLADETDLEMVGEEPFYDVYRGIAYPEDRELLKKHDYRYDITVIMPGQINGECKKTSGHYHGWTPARTNTYAEVYEVIKGTALYILQKSTNFDTNDPSGLVVDDVILVTVPEGRTLLVPPNYGHCSVNIGEGPLVFSNLAYVSCPLHYDPVKYYHGMGWYAYRTPEGISLKENSRYPHLPLPRYAAVKENPELGVTWGCPLYESFRKRPEAFAFLGDPDAYVQTIMDSLEFGGEFIRGENV